MPDDGYNQQFYNNLLRSMRFNANNLRLYGQVRRRLKRELVRNTGYIIFNKHVANPGRLQYSEQRRNDTNTAIEHR